MKRIKTSLLAPIISNSIDAAFKDAFKRSGSSYTGAVRFLHSELEFYLCWCIFNKKIKHKI
jgi:hypothetical protein